MHIDLDMIEAAARRGSKGLWCPGVNGNVYAEYEHGGRVETDGLASHMIQDDQWHIVNSQPRIMLELVARLRAAEAKVESAKEYAALLSAPGPPRILTRYERALRTARMAIGEGLTEHLSDEARLKEREKQND